MRKASDKKPPRRARRKAVPMKLVTLLADFEGDMCMYFLRYNTRLLALARYARFSNISTTAQIHTASKSVPVNMYQHFFWQEWCTKINIRQNKISKFISRLNCSRGSDCGRLIIVEKYDWYTRNYDRILILPPKSKYRGFNYDGRPHLKS